jgi:hypothetical protein
VSTFAPALRDKRNKKEIHVRRHIELTAVLTEMLGQKNKSNRIVRFEKEPIEYRRIIISSERSEQTIYDEEFDPGSG